MFNVGDHIVYPMHGVGTVNAVEKKTVLGKKGDYYLIELINSSMKVMIPVDNAEKIGIRSIISKRQVAKVVEILAKGKTVREDDWKLRYQNNIDKVKTGSIYEVSAVARDLYRRSLERDLSIMERKLYENAYQLITHELALTKNVDIEEAGNFVSEALGTYKPPKPKTTEPLPTEKPKANAEPKATNTKTTKETKAAKAKKTDESQSVKLAKGTKAGDKESNKTAKPRKGKAS